MNYEPRLPLPRSRLAPQVGTLELAETMVVNAIAPFVLCARLLDALAPASPPSSPQRRPARSARGDDADGGRGGDERREGDDATADSSSAVAAWGHIVNVNALEGKFNVAKKSGGHPHTNMAKAALNMLTLTAARDCARRRVLMNAVDTGWVTDMAV